MYVPLITQLAVLFTALVLLVYTSRHTYTSGHAQNWFSTRPAVITAICVGACGVLFTVLRVIDLERKGAPLESWQLVMASVVYGVGLLVLLSTRSRHG